MSPEAIFESNNVEEVKDMENSWNKESSALATLKEIYPGKGYFVKCSAATKINLEGRLQHKYNYSYSDGWSLVGSGSNKTKLVTHFIENISNFTSLIGPSEGIYDSELPEEFQTLLSMTPGKGYFIKIKDE